MTKTQYADYEKAVEHFHARNNLSGACSPKHSEPEPGFEPYFSWRPCECCGSHLGGDREDYTFATNDNQIIEASICVDCVYYLAYGQLDDMTMMEMGQETTN